MIARQSGQISWTLKTRGVRQAKPASQPDTFGLHQYGENDLRLFCDLLLAANRDWIGPPEGNGELLFFEVRYELDGVAVDYVLVAPTEAGEREALLETRVSFRFDLLGNLVRIEDATSVAPADEEA